MPPPTRRTRAGGPKKRPTRYAASDAASTVDPAALGDALRAHKKGNFDDAAAGYARILAVAPDALDAWMNLAAVEVMRGRARDAEAAYGRALALAPGEPRVLRDAGIGLLAIGRFPPARSALTEAVSIAPGLIGARLVLSRLAAEMGDRDAAIHHAEAAVSHAPDDASSHLEVCRARFDDRDLAPSIAAATRAVALDPELVWARYLLVAARGWAGLDIERDVATLPHHLADAVTAALATRNPDTRAFAAKRETLRHALSIASLEGPVIELGVRHGISTRVIAEVVPRDVHGFDGFVGLPEDWDGRPAGVFATAGEPPDLPPHVALHVGMFHDTLPPFAAALDRSPRLVHVDSDLYESARLALAVLGPKVTPGCVRVFDEYFGNRTWRRDEHRAFEEAAEAFGWVFDHEAVCLFTGQLVTRIVRTASCR